MLPLQGFWIFLIYIITSQTACRNLWRSLLGKPQLPRKNSAYASSLSYDDTTGSGNNSDWDAKAGAENSVGIGMKNLGKKVAHVAAPHHHHQHPGGHCPDDTVTTHIPVIVTAGPAGPTHIPYNPPVIPSEGGRKSGGRIERFVTRRGSVKIPDAPHDPNDVGTDTASSGDVDSFGDGFDNVEIRSKDDSLTDLTSGTRDYHQALSPTVHGGSGSNTKQPHRQYRR